MGSKSLFLAPFTLDFKSTMEILKVPIWIKLLHFPLVLWDTNIFNVIGDKLCHYTKHAKIKVGIISCARICVVVDLKKGPSKAIELNVVV